MSDDLKAAFINAQSSMLQVELAGMLAENQHRINCGNSIAYGEDAFIELQKRYEPILGHNALVVFIGQ